MEGDDDERFFMRMKKPFFMEKYDSIKIIKYKTMKKEKVDSFLTSIEAMNADYIFVTDINQKPCITAKKRAVTKTYKKVAEDRITIVIKEIESWYLAGLSDEASTKFKIRAFVTTDGITKEQFNRLISRKFDSRIDFMLEMLKNFSMEIAKQKNASFKYFAEKFLTNTNSEI